MNSISDGSVSYSKAVANSVINYFNEHDLDFDFDEEKGILTTGFPLRSKIGRLDYRIRFLSDGYVSHATPRIHADEDSLAKVAEYLSRANYAMTFGNFEFDFRDGEIRFKASCRTGDIALNEEQITDTFLIAIAQFEVYGDNLIAVLFDLKEPKEALKEAEEALLD